MFYALEFTHKGRYTVAGEHVLVRSFKSKKARDTWANDKAQDDYFKRWAVGSRFILRDGYEHKDIYTSDSEEIKHV